jgi:zinc protease
MRWSANVVRQVLPNGLTLLVQRDTAAPVVAVVTHVRAGYFDEPDRWVGIAHVLEHMFFKGTARRGPGDIARETQLVGGYINAGTIYDKTVYYTVLPSSDGGTARALDVQADALMHAALDPGELSRELEVIIQEANRKLDSPSAVTGESLYELLFLVHRMRRWRIGNEAGLRTLTARDVREYYQSRYTPDRVIVGIVGNIDPEHVLGIANATYMNWVRPTSVVEPSPEEPDEDASAIRVLRGDVQRPLASLGWRTVGTLHPDAPALDIAASVLGSGRGSRLYRALRVPGIAAMTHASHYTPTEVGVFQLDLEAEADKLDQAIEGTWGQVASLAHDGPSDQELERVRALLETSWARRNESMEGRAATLCDAEALGSCELADELFARAMAVTRDDVRRVMTHYGRDARMSAVVYLPRDANTKFEDAWPPKLAARPASPAAITLPADTPASGTEASPSRKEGPGKVVHWAFPKADLLVRPKPGSGVVSLLLHFPEVPAAESQDNAGISWLLARSVIRGAGSLGGEELAQAAELAGGSIAPSVGTESIGWGITVRPDGVSRGAAILRMLAMEPHLDDADVVRERELQMSDARRVRDDMLRYPLQRVLLEGFPAHSYGLPKLGDPDDVARLKASDVRAWATRVVSRRPVIIVVGDVDADAAAAGVELLTDWTPPVTDLSASVTPPVWMAGRGSESRDKKQSALALAFRACQFDSSDRFAITVAGSVLSGLAGRLFEELREKRALAYTVAALPWLARRAGVMLCYIATSPDREDEARTAMLEELGRLSADAPTSDELERARNYAAGSVEIRQQSGRAIAAEILEAWVHGSLNDLIDTPARLRTVSRDDVVRIAEGVFRPDERAEYVVRGMSS